MKAYATKYVELAELRGEELAKRWFQDVKKNAKTPAFHKLPEDKVIPHAVTFYQNFSKMFSSEKPDKGALKYFGDYAQITFKAGIPLDEAIYALALMRRHIWLFAEFQDVFMKGIDQRQAVETLSRTILVFDYAEYEIAKRYQELILADMEKKLGR